MADTKHISVLPREVLHWLDPQPGQTIVDATVGVGGHSALLWERMQRKIPLTPGPSPPGGRAEGMLIAIDQDPRMLDIAKQRLPDSRITWKQRNFEDIAAVLDDLKI